MKYQVPQFIEVEDKIFGPFTFKQFAYLAGGAGAAFLAYRLLPFIVGIMVAVPFAAFGAALAFYKVNGRPFVDVLQSAFEYVTKNRLYIWKKEEKKPKTEAEAEEKVVNSFMPGSAVPKLSDSKLKELTWSLDINETIYSKDQGMRKGGTVPNTKPF